MSDRTLVLIEDDAGDALLVSEMLFDVDPDLHVTQFATLQSAIDSWPIEAECVLLDLGLPDAFGLSALEKLQAHVPDAPVVVLTGRLDDASGPAALAAGAQDFLVKGQVDAPGLERALRYAVERGRATTYQRELIAAEVRAEENSRLQRGLLPSPLIQTDELRFAPFYRPGRERALLGGDFYDVVQTDTGVHLLIGDVSGHSLDEAALGVALRIAWRSLVLAGLSQPDVLLGVEKVLLAERGDDERYASVATVSLDPDFSTARVALCGHPAPLLIKADSVVELVAEPTPALAIAPGISPQLTTVHLAGDWGLLLFTDGLIEGSVSPGAVDRLGATALARHVEALIGRSIPRHSLASNLLAEAERRHGGPLPDDVAVLTVGTCGWWG
ncbi:MAG: SpoIIE family protein phosphatase [Frankiaceae bacterium]|nr:SpoIIE family protein phosphatase [Frankiaceae bacterium]MBV9869872.1 SpoIIE family protein phosphatase [Frankiaceae bacterium]